MCQPFESMHAWTRLIMDCHTVFKSPQAVANGLTDIKLCWLSFSSFSIVAEYTGGLQVSPFVAEYTGGLQVSPTVAEYTGGL